MILEHTRHWKLNVVMMVLSQILVMSGFCAAMPFVPLYLKEGLGIASEGDRGLYLSIFSFAGMLAYGIFNPVWGALSDRLLERYHAGECSRWSGSFLFRLRKNFLVLRYSLFCSRYLCDFCQR